MSPTILIIEYVPSEAQRAAPREGWISRAEQIGGIEGLRWKYWLRNGSDGRMGGVYLFDTPDAADTAADLLEASLAQAGATSIRRRAYEVDAGLSSVTRGVIPA